MRTCLGVVMVFALAAAGWGGTGAQEQAQAPDPAKEIAALKQQISQLQQKTPAELMKAAQDAYAALFRESKEKAEPGCKAAGGKWRVSVTTDGKTGVTSVTVTCEER